MRCLQEFFQKGLHKPSNYNYLSKSLITEIEGKDGDGTVTNWMDGGRTPSDWRVVTTELMELESVLMSYTRSLLMTISLTKEGGGMGLQPL